MPVYLPTAATGNSRVLVTLGPAGELMGLSYPHIDFAQNIREGLTAIHIAPAGRRPARAVWLFDDRWDRTQSYAPGSNVVHTTLASEPLGLTVEITDVVPPDSALLARRFVLRSHIPTARTVSVLHYFYFTLGEVPWKQSVRYLPDAAAMVQYFRDIAVAVGGDAFTAIRCGRARDGERSAKTDIADGALTGQPEDIGEVDFAVAWTLKLRTRAETRVLMISAAETEAAALRQLSEAKQTRFAQLAAAAQCSDRAFGRLPRRAFPAVRREGVVRACASAGSTDTRSSPGEPSMGPAGDGSFAEAYERAVLSLRLLQDAQTGAIAAAPEFDPTYERCGGYGYCWPRDGAYAAMALAEIGHRDAAERFLDWCAAAQGGDGLWRQRYWADASLGPSWCAPERREQLDQSATVLFLAGKLLASLRGRPHTTFMDRHGLMIERGAKALIAAADLERMHCPACDLWESFEGAFTYTAAAIHGALGLLRTPIARRLGPDAQKAAREIQRAIKSTVCGKLWLGTHLARGIATDGSIDGHIDSSILGALEPFNLLSLDDEAERAMVEHSVATIEEHLGTSGADGNGIFRFQFDTYLGGAIGCVNTLWLAKVLLRLAQWYQGRNEKRAADYLQRAKSHIRFCLKHRTPTGLFPELIGRTPDTPYWAAPHAWASALFVGCAILLQSVAGDHDG